MFDAGKLVLLFRGSGWGDFVGRAECHFGAIFKQSAKYFNQHCCAAAATGKIII